MRFKLFAVVILIFVNSVAFGADALRRKPAQQDPTMTPATAPADGTQPKQMRRRRQGPQSKRAKMWNDYLALKSFEISGLYVDQGSSRSSGSGMIAWTPAFWFNEELAVGVHLGLSALQTNDGLGNKTLFGIYDYQVFARYVMKTEWDLELMGGAQTWGSGVGTAGIATGQFAWDPKVHLLGVVDRVFVSYSRYFQNVGANEYRAGLGFLF